MIEILSFECVLTSPVTSFWFSKFGAIMLMGDVTDTNELAQMEQRGVDWSRECLGSFYVKPNYPGRSSHVCTGDFLVTDAARNRGVGRLMGECYLEWAPKLGYHYSVFNLVYETNVASLRIWDALGFKRIGRIKGCGSLKSYEGQYVDAIIFGRELGGEEEDYVTEERFDKIRFYLKTGTYPNGADRSEKSRLRSAATHYRLIPSESGNEADEKLMLKGKEVISDPHRQYEIARNIHAASHGGINKTTAIIADRYHWVRIKETVSAAIRNCHECKEPTPKPKQPREGRGLEDTTNETAIPAPTRFTLTKHQTAMAVSARALDMSDVLAGAQQPPKMSGVEALREMQSRLHRYDDDMPVDPQIMQGMQQWEVTSGDQAMEIDGSSTIPTNTSGNDETEVDMMLREELEAQIRS